MIWGCPLFSNYYSRKQMGNRTHSFLQVLSNLIIQLELLVELFENLFVDFVVLDLLGRGLSWRVEKVEKGWDGMRATDESGAVSRCKRYLVQVVVSQRTKPTLISLLLDLDGLGEILIFLPLDLAPDGAVVDVVTRIAQLVLH